MQNRMAEAAMPRMASARLSQRRSCVVRLLLLCGCDLLQLGAELGEDRLGVDALGARLLDPLVDDGCRALLHLGLQRRRRGHDLHARLLEDIEPFLVARVPGLAGSARDMLIAELLDRRLLL